MKDKKKVMIGILSVLVCIMAVGYALLAQELTINGTATIDSTWDVKITGIAQSGEAVGGATSKASPTFTSTTANFSVSLKNFESYTLKTNGYYKYVARIDNTLIYANVKEKYENNAKEFIKKLGY